MPNYNVIAKGKYTHKQTSDVLKIERFLIVRRKKSRLLLLDVNNCAEENLTGLLLQIDQFDVRGKSLGSIQTSMKDLSQKPGAFVLKKEIEIHRSCIDFHVQVISAEYGNYVYRLGENDTYVTYDKPEKKENVDRKAIRRKLGNRNFVAKERTYKTPVFVSLFIAGLLTVGGAFLFLYLPNKDPQQRGSVMLVLFLIFTIVYFLIMGTIWTIKARVKRVARDESKYHSVYKK